MAGINKQSNRYCGASLAAFDLISAKTLQFPRSFDIYYFTKRPKAYTAFRVVLRSKKTAPEM